MTLTRYDLEPVMMSYLNNPKPELSGVHLRGHDLVITLTLYSKFLNQTYGVRSVYVYWRLQYVPVLTNLPVVVRSSGAL